MNEILGIDVGATGIKGGIVDIKSGKMLTVRYKLPTPKSGKPSAIISTINAIIDHFEWRTKPVGIGFPAIIKNNKSWSASNIHKSWIGYSIKKEIEKATSCPIVIINDADAAGIAEVAFGKGRGVKGTLLLLTLGTGIGSALFYNGELIPNTEFGHLKFKKDIAEAYVSNSARLKFGWDWKSFGVKLNALLCHIDFLFSPNLIIIGGGISKKFDSYSKSFSEHINVCAAEKGNDAGIVGAAMAFKIYNK